MKNKELILAAIISTAMWLSQTATKWIIIISWTAIILTKTKKYLTKKNLEGE